MKSTKDASLRYEKVLLMICLLIPGLAVSHDFYLLPDQFMVVPGKTIKVLRYIDDLFPAPPKSWDPSHIVSFQSTSRQGTKDLISSKAVGDPAAAEIRLGAEGNHLLTYVSQPKSITLEPKKFNDYLKEEGLDPIIEMRKQRGESSKEGREQYTRYAKVLLQVGRTSDEIFRKVTGLKLEIVPEQNPYQMKAGEKLTAQVLFAGQPLTNALVSAKYAGSKTKPGYTRESRTDRHGKITISLDDPGAWLICLVHMVAARNNPQADWESFWGSLTFELRP